MEAEGSLPLRHARRHIGGAQRSHTPCVTLSEVPASCLLTFALFLIPWYLLLVITWY